MNGEKSEQNSTLSLKSKIALLVTVPLIVIIICSVVIVITAKRLEGETPQEMPTTKVEELLKEPTDTPHALSDITKLIDSAGNASDTLVDCSASVKINLVKTSLTPSREKLLKFTLNEMGNRIASEYYDCDLYRSAYGEENRIQSEFLPKDGDVPLFEETDSGFKYTYEPAEGFSGLFADADKIMLDGVSERFSSQLKTYAPKIVFSEGAVKLTVEADPKKARIKSVSKERTYLVCITFDGENGEKSTVEAEITATGTLFVTYAGIEIEQDIITLDKNGYKELSIKANVAENASPSEFTVSFSSSDTSVCTVNENGAVEAVKSSDKPVTITAKLSYLGNTYTDTCEVYVKQDSATGLFGIS